MTSPRKSATRAGKAPAKLTCLDDVPEIGRLAARQRFFLTRGPLLAILPLIAVLFVLIRFFPRSTSLWFAAAVGVSLLWALAVLGYGAYLWWTLRCPACHERFGTAETCRSCHLPRHRNSPRVEVKKS